MTCYMNAIIGRCPPDGARSGALRPL